MSRFTSQAFPSSIPIVFLGASLVLLTPVGLMGQQALPVSSSATELVLSPPSSPATQSATAQAFSPPSGSDWIQPQPNPQEILPQEGNPGDWGKPGASWQIDPPGMYPPVDASGTDAKQASPTGQMSLMSGMGQLKFSGAISLLAVASDERTFVPWNPFFVLPPSAFGLDTNTFELHGRQSNLQFLYEGPNVGSMQLGGLARFYFTNSSLSSDTYGLMPVLAFGELRNERWRFSVGLQPDLFAPRDPAVIPITLLGGAGNAGTFRGQLRVERYFVFSEELQWTWQGAISDPISTVLIDATRRTTEANGWPNIETRLALGLGEKLARAGGRSERMLELGVAGLVGQLRNSQNFFDLDEIDPNIPIRSIIDVGGMSVDGRWNVTDRLGVVAEGYFGQGIGNYAATIFQTFHPHNFQAIRGRGGFLEAFYYLNDQIHVHGGYGVEGAIRRDLANDQGIARNSAYFVSLFWDLHRSVQTSFQVDYRQTDLVAFADNDAVVLYHQWLVRF
ncbi:MAG: hypothetical protein ACK5ZC_13975 [Pirellulaceae bacterium]